MGAFGFGSSPGGDGDDGDSASDNSSGNNSVDSSDSKAAKGWTATKSVPLTAKVATAWTSVRS
jgi:hypothetical protein